MELYHLFRYGGWYTDLDTVTIRPTNHIENTVAISGDFVANGNLVFSKNYKVRLRLFLKTCHLSNSIQRSWWWDIEIIDKFDIRILSWSLPWSVSQSVTQPRKGSSSWLSAVSAHSSLSVSLGLGRLGAFHALLPCARIVEALTLCFFFFYFSIFINFLKVI